MIILFGVTIIVIGVMTLINWYEIKDLETENRLLRLREDSLRDWLAEMQTKTFDEGLLRKEWERSEIEKAFQLRMDEINDRY